MPNPFSTMHDKASINCKNMASETRVNTVNRFDPDLRRMLNFVLIVLLCFYAFLTVFSMFQKVLALKFVFSMKFCEFGFLPEFCDFFLLLSVSWILHYSCVLILVSPYTTYCIHRTETCQILPSVKS